MSSSRSGGWVGNGAGRKAVRHNYIGQSYIGHGGRSKSCSVCPDAARAGGSQRSISGFLKHSMRTRSPLPTDPPIHTRTAALTPFPNYALCRGMCPPSMPACAYPHILLPCLHAPTRLSWKHLHTHRCPMFVGPAITTYIIDGPCSMADGPRAQDGLLSHSEWLRPT